MNTLNATQQSNATGAPTAHAVGNSHGGNITFAAPIYTSPSGNFNLSVGASRSGAWTHTQGQSFSAGIGGLWRF